MTKTQMLERVTALIHGLPHDARFDVDVASGVRRLSDAERPEGTAAAGWEEFVPNGTATITVKVNGGARDETQTGEQP